MDIKAAVKQLTHKYKTNNPFELAQLLNIIIMYAELGSTWGYFTTYKRSKFIILNQDISEELQAYTCAHELGHSVLHKGVSTPFLKSHTLFSRTAGQHLRRGTAPAGRAAAAVSGNFHPPSC